MLFVSLLSAYLLAGLVFSIAFVLFGYRAILPEASGSGIVVRFIWVGGAVTLWPYLLFRWAQRRDGQ